MIENTQQLQDTRDALAQVERALLSLKEKVKSKNPQLLAAMSEGYQTDIMKLRAESRSISESSTRRVVRRSTSARKRIDGGVESRIAEDVAWRTL